MEDKLRELISEIENNMKKCNVGDLYGAMYHSGYCNGVNDVLKMMKELLND